MPVNAGWTLPGTTPQTPGIRLTSVAHGDDAGGGADDVDDVAFAAAGADGVPVRVERADGDGDAGAQAELRGPLGREMAGDVVGGEVLRRCSLVADAGEQRIDAR